MLISSLVLTYYVIGMEDSKIGKVVSTETGPSFGSIPIRVDQGIRVRPGQMLYAPLGSRSSPMDRVCIIRVSTAFEHNPYEEPQTSQIKDMFGIQALPDGSDLIRKFVVAETEPLEIATLTDNGYVFEPPNLIVPSGTVVYGNIPEDLANGVLGFPDPSDKNALILGNVVGSSRTPVTLNANVVLPRHILIVGSTGTGKSWLLGKIAEQLHEKGIRMINIDIHGEMNKATEEMGGKIYVPGRDLRVPLSSLAEPEILGMIPVQHELHIDILTKAVINLKNRNNRFGINDLKSEAIRVGESYGAKQNTLDIISARIDQLAQIPFIGEGIDWKTALFEGGTIINIDCRLMPQSQLQLVVAAITRDVYNSRRENAIPPLVMAIDEAHLFLPATDKADTASVLSQLIKMGRHIALGLILVSQTPGDLDKSITKITNTRFIFAIEPSELSSIYGALSDAPPEIVKGIPKMKSGTCLLVGNRETVRHATVFDVGRRRTHHGGETPNML
jgi:hypothetical protein